MSFYKSVFTLIAISLLASSGTASPAAATTTVAAATAQTASVVRLNVNSAKAKEFANVKGVDASMARSIVAFRKKHGEFKSLDDLAKVRKLSKLNPAELKAIEEQLSI